MVMFNNRLSIKIDKIDGLSIDLKDYMTIALGKEFDELEKYIEDEEEDFWDYNYLKLKILEGKKIVDLNRSERLDLDFIMGLLSKAMGQIYTFKLAKYFSKIRLVLMDGMGRASLDNDRDYYLLEGILRRNSKYLREYRTDCHSDLKMEEKLSLIYKDTVELIDIYNKAELKTIELFQNISLETENLFEAMEDVVLNINISRLSLAIYYLVCILEIIYKADYGKEYLSEIYRDNINHMGEYMRNQKNTELFILKLINQEDTDYDEDIVSLKKELVKDISKNMVDLGLVEKIYLESLKIIEVINYIYNYLDEIIISKDKLYLKKL